MIVAGAIGQAERSAWRGGRIAEKADARRFVLDQIEAPSRHGVAADLDVGGARLRQRQGELHQPLAARHLGRHPGRLRAVIGLGDEGDALALRRVGPDQELAPLRHRQGAEALGAGADRLGAVGEHDRSDAGIDRRRHPGVEAEQRRAHARLRIEGRRDAVPSGRPCHQHADDEEEHERGADGVGVLAVGARLGPARLELGDEAGEPLAMRRPQHGGFGAGRGAELVLIGRGRTVLDIGVLLQPPERLGPGRQAQAEQRQQRHEKGDAEGDQHAPMGERRQQGPEVEQRDDEKGGDDQERPQQRFPDPLADQGEAAQPHAPFKAPGKRLVLRLFRRRSGTANRRSRHRQGLAQSGGRGDHRTVKHP